MCGVLYISYTGLLEPLGQSQVLAYQERLAPGREVHILSFERSSDLSDTQRMNEVRQRLAAAGIHWHPCVYHRRPSIIATLWDIAVGAVIGSILVLRHGLRIVHSRSYVPAAMALVVRRLSKARFLFDMRGFWADERVDGGLWPRDGRMYRIAKLLERRFLLAADHVVSLTQAGVNELARFDYLQECMPPTTVIPTCADLARFKPGARQRTSTGFTLGYVGTVGTWYLFDATVAAFRILLQLRPDSRMIVLNREEHSLIKAALARGGIDPAKVEIRSANHHEVPAIMAQMDAAAFFIKPVFSKQASAPTKLAEFLGCGIPCLSNAGVGDMADVLRGTRVGIAVDVIDELHLRRGVEDLIELCAEPGVRERCVQTAHQHFSLEKGVELYRVIYNHLGQL